MEVKISSGVINNLNAMGFEKKKMFLEILREHNILSNIGEEAERLKEKKVNEICYDINNFKFSGKITDICLIESVELGEMAEKVTELI